MGQYGHGDLIFHSPQENTMDFLEDFDMGPGGSDDWPISRARRWGEGDHPITSTTLIREFLDQGDAWASRSGYVKIADMTPGHALRTVIFLLDRARDVALTFLLSPGIVRTSVLLERVWDDKLARSWLGETRLVDALMERATEEPTATLPWQRILR